MRPRPGAYTADTDEPEQAYKASDTTASGGPVRQDGFPDTERAADATGVGGRGGREVAEAPERPDRADKPGREGSAAVEKKPGKGDRVSFTDREGVKREGVVAHGGERITRIKSGDK